MVLIFLSWIYILFTTTTIGFVTNQLLHLKNKDFIIHTILGLFATTVLSTVWAIFERINIEFHIFFMGINLFFFYKFRLKIWIECISFSKQLIALKTELKVILYILLFLIIGQCASAPFIIDNESYYIQTIKWINEYGFVKGLANLHFFLAQTSSWHLLQSVYNFSFLYDKFNDISGFCLLLGNTFSILKLNEYFKNKNKTYLIIGLLPLANVFFFQFISAPSPDLAIYIISFIIFFYFIENLKTINSATFNLVLILVIFSIFIKTTAIALIFIPIILLIINYKKLVTNLARPILITALVLVLFVVKNILISGYPFFPSLQLNIFEYNYKLPLHTANLYYQETKLYAFSLTHEQYNSLSKIELFARWFTLPKLHGLFNKWSIVLICTMPVVVYKYYNKRAFWMLYLIMCLQLTALFITSPQYRFFINFLLFFSITTLALVLYKTQHIIYFLYLSIFLTGFVLLVPIQLHQLTQNKFTLSTNQFSIDYILYPHPNSNANTSFEKLKDGNLEFYSPLNNDFFWGTGNGKLPCVNKAQLKYFSTYYHIKPQLRSINLKDGFYSKNISRERHDTN